MDRIVGDDGSSGVIKELSITLGRLQKYIPWILVAITLDSIGHTATSGITLKILEILAK